MNLFYCNTDQVRVSSICVNFCRSYASCGTKNDVIYSFPLFSLTCFDILSRNFAFYFVFLYFRSSSSVVSLRQFCRSLKFNCARCIPLNLRSKTRQRATLLLLLLDLLLSIGRNGKLHISNMTNVTISISTSQISRSWVAIFQQLPPMASLFRSLYDMPRLASRMIVLFWGRRGFQISFSNRDTSRSTWNRHWGSFMVDTGILSKQYEVSLSRMLNDILWPDHIQWQSPTDQTLYRTRPFTELWEVSIEQ